MLCVCVFISELSEIDAQFDLDEDTQEDSVEKYGSDLDISSDEHDSSDEGTDQVPSLDANRRGNIPHSMPVNVNFGIDPVTKRPRDPVARVEKRDKNVNLSRGIR